MRRDKTILVLGCAVCLCLSAAAQDSSRNLYLRSLSTCIESVREHAPATDAVVVVENAVVGDPGLFFPRPSRIQTARVEYLDSKALAKRFRQTGSDFSAIEIKPLVNFRDVLLVDCADYRVSARKGKVILGVVGGTKIRWKFDPVVGEYIVVNTERWWPQM